MASSTGNVNVLLIGGGGREHALAWKLRQSPRLGELWISDPDNPGLAALGRLVDVPVDAKQPFRVQSFCQKNSIGLVIIGPEEPLAAGMADVLLTPLSATSGPVPVVFGPIAAGARLEADKAWCKQLIRGASVPMAEGRVFTDFASAKNYVETREDPPVIKASGLAKGKGVVVASSIAEAVDALQRIMVKLEFGEAGRTVVIEERLEGREVSVLAVTDGRTLYVLEACQDHKRLGDNDTGPNTGGMGVICPGGGLSDAELEIVQSQILVPTLDALRREGIDFRGVLYAGIMMTPAGPKVLEFNTRFGDPECQALMMRLDSDLIDLCMSCGNHTLDDIDIRWSPAASCCVVLAAGGYPARPRQNAVITGLEAASKVPGVQVFHAGTRKNERGEIVTAGGRVLSVTASGDSMSEARQRAYEAASLIHFEGKQMRTDIGSGSLTPIA